MKQIIYQKRSQLFEWLCLDCRQCMTSPIGTNALSKKALVVSHKSRLAIIRINEWLTVRRVVFTVLIDWNTIDKNGMKTREWLWIVWLLVWQLCKSSIIRTAPTLRSSAAKSQTDITSTESTHQKHAFVLMIDSKNIDSFWEKRCCRR